jgi:hypothetical protein
MASGVMAFTTVKIIGENYCSKNYASVKNVQFHHFLEIKHIFSFTSKNVSWLVIQCQLKKRLSKKVRNTMLGFFVPYGSQRFRAFSPMGVTKCTDCILE